MITEDDVRQIAQEEITKNTNKNVYSVSPIPIHNHDGINSIPIDPNTLINSSLYFTVREITLSSAKILALNTTPITLIPAIGSSATSTNLNTVIIVEGITAKIYAGSVAYTGANALEFRYTNASGVKITADIANTFINSASNNYIHVAGIITAFTPVFNSPIVVCVPTANPANGNGKIVLSIKYRIITL